MALEALNQSGDRSTPTLPDVVVPTKTKREKNRLDAESGRHPEAHDAVVPRLGKHAALNSKRKSGSGSADLA